MHCNVDEVTIAAKYVIKHFNMHTTYRYLQQIIICH